jgi:hypothetical protein
LHGLGEGNIQGLAAGFHFDQDLAGNEVVDVVLDAIDADNWVFMKTVVPVHPKDVHEVFFEGLGILPFIAGAIFPALLKGNGTSFDVCPSQHISPDFCEEVFVQFPQQKVLWGYYATIRL